MQKFDGYVFLDIAKLLQHMDILKDSLAPGYQVEKSREYTRGISRGIQMSLEAVDLWTKTIKQMEEENECTLELQSLR